MRIVLLGFCLALLGSAALAQAPTRPPPSNPEMSRIFREDQADRNSPKIDWAVVRPRDEQRRAATRKLLADGQLHTAEDFQAAAFVFQHGSQPADYLLAHTLAVVAVAKGDPRATWIAAATLDRYLQMIGQKQIYGTQFTLQKAAGATTTQEPYDRELISDALRTELGVPPLEAQAKQPQVTGEYMRKAQGKTP